MLNRLNSRGHELLCRMYGHVLGRSRRANATLAERPTGRRRAPRHAAGSLPRWSGLDALEPRVLLSGALPPAEAASAFTYDLDFNAGVDDAGADQGDLLFNGPDGFQVRFTDDDSSGGSGGNADGVHINDIGFGNDKAGTGDLVLGAYNTFSGANNLHSSGIVAEFNWGAQSVSLFDADDDLTLKTLYAYDQFGNQIGATTPGSQQTFTISTADTGGQLIHAVEFDTAFGAAGGSADGTYFTIDDFQVVADPDDAPQKLDVYDFSVSQSTPIGEIFAIRTPQTGQAHYDFFSASGHPFNVNVGPQRSNLWVHENQSTGEFSFGFIFGQDADAPNNNADLDFRIVDTDNDGDITRVVSDDAGEADPVAGTPGAFTGDFSYGVNTDGIAVSGINGNAWTIIIDSVTFGVVNEWFASNGAFSDFTHPAPGDTDVQLPSALADSGIFTDFSDDLPLTIGNEIRIVPHGVTPSFVGVNPATPINPFPANGATDVPVDAVLDWATENPAVADFEVKLSDTGSLPASGVDVADSTYDPGALQFNTTYTWQVVSDFGGDTFESALWSFTTVALPDLVVGAPAGPAAGTAGQAFDLDLRIDNIGTADANGFVGQVLLSSDASVSGDDTVLADFTDTLPVGEGDDYSFNVALPDVPAGAYNLLFVADPGELIDEQSEANNLLTLPITVSDPVTVTATDPTGSTNASVTQVDLTLSGPVDETAANDASSYELLDLGADRQLGGGDDVPLALGPNYLAGSTDVQLLVVGENAVDLSAWDEQDYGSGGAGNWTVAGDNESVFQSTNGEPTFFVSDFDLLDRTFAGRIQVTNDQNDDDFVGVAFGYQENAGEPDSYYLLYWKRQTQTTSGVTGEEGLKLVKVTNSSGVSESNMFNAIWNGETTAITGGGQMELLASNLGSTLGWVEGTDYDFKFTYLADGTIDIEVTRTSDGQVFWDTTLVDPSPLGAGKVAFFNESQANVRYSGLQQAEVLPDGVYQLTAFAGAPALADPNGAPIDGDNDGFAGADFVSTFTIDTTPPIVESLAVGPLDNSILVNFLEVGGLDPVAATDPDNYSVLRAGGDAAFGDANDATVPIDSINLVDSQTVELVLTPPLAEFDLGPADFAFGGLLDDLYQVTVDGANSVEDLAGNVLDGDNDGNAGGDFVGTITIDLLPAFAAVDLQSASDTGADPADDVTADATPTFDLFVNEPGSGTFSIVDDNTAATVFTANVAYVSDGEFPETVSPALPDGRYTANFSFTAGTPTASPAAATPLPFTIDTVDPQVADAAVDGAGIELTIAEAVGMDLAGLTDPANYDVHTTGGDGLFGDGNEVDHPVDSVSYDPNTGVATLHFADALEDELYRLTVATSAIADLAGNPLDGGAAFSTDLPLLRPDVAQIDPVSYDMLNGQTGTYSYWDRTYNGTGNVNLDGSPLADGLGQLTDGVLGADDWTADLGNGNAYEWVGWNSIAPDITFDFGAPVDIASAAFHLNNFTTPGDVALPATVTVSFSNDGSTFANPVTVTTTEAERDDRSVRWITVPANQTARYLNVAMTDGRGPWIFLSEVNFEAAGGSAVSLALNPAADTGVPDDAKTNDPTPDFDVAVSKAGRILLDVDADGTPDVNQLVPEGGTYTLTSPIALADGLHTANLSFAPAVGTPATATLNFEVDTLGPAVASTTIASLAQGDDRFEFTTSEPIDEATADDSDLTLLDPDGNPLAVDDVIDLGGNSHFRVILEQPLTKSGQYDLTIGPGVADEAGNDMDQDGDGTPGDPFNASFTIVDTTPPTIVTAEPAGVVAPGVETVTVQFSEPIDGLSFTPADVQITTPGGAIDPAEITITPAASNLIDAGGVVVAVGDEWAVSDSAFNADPTAMVQFAENIATMMTGGGTGNFIAYSNNGVAYGNRIAAAMTNAGHAWTETTSFTINQANLAAFDGIFLAGGLGSGAANVAELVDYVEAGGSVFVMAGTGDFGNAASEAAAWNPLLGEFGLQFGDTWFNNGFQFASVTPNSHPLFDGLNQVYWAFGQTANEITPADPLTEQLDATFSGVGDQPVIAVSTVFSGGSDVAGLQTFDISFPAQTTDGAYNVEVGPNVTDPAGNPMPDPFMHSFDIDAAGPTVENVTIDADTITVDFDDRVGVDPATATDAANYALVDSGGDGTFADGNENPVDLSTLIDSIDFNPTTQVATLLLNSDLPDEVYQLTVDGTNTVADLLGNPLLDGSDYLSPPIPVDNNDTNVDIDLKHSSDTGASGADNITNDATPTFDIAIDEPGLLEFDGDGDGAFEAGVPLAAPGTYSFTAPTVGHGEINPVARLTGIDGGVNSASLPVVIDLLGPELLAGPTSEQAPLFSRTLAFNEAIDPASLLIQNIDFFGPGGLPLPPVLSITDLGGGTSFQLEFDALTAPGTYRFDIQPSLTDLAGNPLNQDADANNGEDPQDLAQDVFALNGDADPPQVLSHSPDGRILGPADSLTLVFDELIDPLTFDVGDVNLLTPAGPLPVGDLAVTPTDLSPRGATTFRIDFPPQAAGGQYTAVVGPDVLDLSGNQMAASYEADFIIDLVGPRALGATFLGTPNTNVTGVEIAFDEPIDPASVDPADLAATDPAGDPVAVASVAPANGDTVLRFTFATPQTMPGLYAVALAPNLADPLGNDMDQDADGTGAEPVEDRFEATFLLEQANLQVFQLTPPTAPSFGQAVVVSWVGTNVGAVPVAENRFDSIVLSENNVLGDADDVPLGAAPVQGQLDPGQIYTASRTVTLPVRPDLSVGDHDFTLFLAVDRDNDVIETVENDNHLGLPLTITKPSGPAVLPSPTIHGDNARFIQLQFDSPVDPATVNPQTLAFTGPGGPVNIAAVRQTAPDAFEVDLGRLGDAGPYTFSVDPAVTDTLGHAMNQDGDNANGEPGDDAFSAVINVDLPDLVVQHISAPAAAAPGDTISLTYRIANVGDAPAVGNFVERFGVSGDAAVGGDVDINSFSRAINLDPGDFVDRTISLTLPSTLPFAGDLRIVVVADANDQMDEMDETNNAAVDDQPIGVPAQLQLSLSRAAADEADPNGVTGFVTRSGDPSAPLTVDLSSNDPSEATVPASVTIPAGSVTASFPVALPADNLVDADQNVQIEADAADHDPATVSLLVRNVDRPSLSLAGVPASMNEGDSVTVTVTRDIVSPEPATVFLQRSANAQLAMPNEATIPANQPSTSFILTAVDNFVVELQQVVDINAAAVGYNGDDVSVTVIDDDAPVLAMTVLEPSFSEAAGLVPNAVTVERLNATPHPLVVALAFDDASELFVQPSVTIPANQTSATFSLFAIDDAISDGVQTVNITAKYTTGGGQPVDAGAVAAAVDVTDDDGDTLAVSVAPSLVGEGSSAQITVARNTDTANALTVDLASSDTTELTVPATVTIPAGQPSVTISAGVESDGVEDGNQSVTVTASRAGFNPGADSLVVSDADLPDIVIEQLQLVDATGNPLNAIPTEDFFHVKYAFANRGFGSATFVAPDELRTAVFLSTDAVFGNDDDIQIGDGFAYQGTLNVGDAVPRMFTSTTRSPLQAGDYFLLAVADVTDQAEEAREDNNVAVIAQPIAVEAAYSAVVETDLTQAIAGQTVPMRGSAANPDGSPAQHQTVNIHILVRNTERVITAVTDENGEFDVDFTPLPNEGGEYSIFATHPGVDSAPIQDSFTVLGLNAAPAGPDLTVLEGAAALENLSLRNLSTVPLTTLTAAVIDKPDNLDVAFDFPAGRTLAGLADLPLLVNVVANDASTPSSVVSFRINSSEGPSLDIEIDVTVQPLVSNLVADRTRLSESVLVGGQKLLTFDVTNEGGAAASPVEIILPQGLPNWISLASPGQFDLPAGQTATVSLLLTPPDGTPLLPLGSTMFVLGPDGSINMPFTFRPVSSAVGDLEITVVDELFYFAAGAPELEGAQVRLRDNVDRDVVVAQGTTDADGLFRVDDLQEGFYYLQLSEDDHESFSTPIFVEGNEAGDFLNEQQYFLSRDFVQYNWTVEEFDFEDRTEITVSAVFDTTVPAPFLVVDPTVVSVGPLQLGGDALQYDLTLQNTGLTQIENVRLAFDNHPLYDIEPLTDTIGTLPGGSTVSIPVVIERTQDAPVGPCTMFGSVHWGYDAGPNFVNKQTRLTFTNVDGVCPVSPPIPWSPAPPVGGGGSPVGGGRPNSVFVPPRPPRIQQPETVNAQVGIEISQDLVLTRQGFDATLELINETDQPLTDISVELIVLDQNGELANERFGIADPNVDAISAIDGTGVLLDDTTGEVEWILVPRDEAAPDGPAQYFIGGALAYTTEGQTVEVDLTPVAVTVEPNPQLFLDYFLQRDVFSDDPFTPEVEPAEPFALGVIIRNEGAGDARNLRIESAQPEIVDNDKGLLIDFAIVASQVANQNLSPSLTLPFGDLPAGDTTVGQWLMEATLQGHFVDYNAEFTHTNPFGIEDISPVKQVLIHEMLMPFQATGDFDDGLPDFLANDVPDPAGVPMEPDTAHLSDGSTEPVALARDIVADGNVSLGDLQVDVDATVDPGFNYFRFPDPGQGDFRIVSVQRSDGSSLPLDNVRQTDRTFLAAGQLPVYEDIVHMVDNDSTGAYTITYEPNDSDGPNITVLEPDPDVRVDPVTSLVIDFSEPVVGFDKDDLELTRNDVPLPLDSLALTQLAPTRYELHGGNLQLLSSLDGTYRLTVDNAGVVDDIGNVAEAPGVGTWVKQGDVPEITGVAVNDGLEQRSTLVNVVLTFNTGLNFQELINTGQIDQEVRIVDADNPGEALDLDETHFAWDPVNFRLTIDLTVDGVGGSERSTVPEANYRVELNTLALATDFGTHLGDQGDDQSDGTAVRDRSTGADDQDLYRLPGDTDGDRDIDLLNLRDYRSLIGTVEGDGAYRAEYDLDADGDIDLDDFLFARDALKRTRGL